MKNILNLIVIFLLFVIAFGCDKKVSNEPEELNQFDGNWEEEYHYNYYPGEIAFPQAKSFDDTTKNAKTIIKFEEQTITILTFPLKRHYYISGNEVKWGSLADTMYKGTYMINRDTIVMKIKGCSNQESIFYKMDKDSTVKFTFLKSNDVLKLNAVTPTYKDSFVVAINISSFLWGYSYRKSDGNFVKR